MRYPMTPAHSQSDRQSPYSQASTHTIRRLPCEAMALSESRALLLEGHGDRPIVARGANLGSKQPGLQAYSFSNTESADPPLRSFSADPRDRRKGRHLLGIPRSYTVGTSRTSGD